MNSDAILGVTILMRFLNRYLGVAGFAAASAILKVWVDPGKGPWDLKIPLYGTGTGPSKGDCPTPDCTWTVTLCGECYWWDVPGNIHFGLLGRIAGFPQWWLHYGAGVAQIKDQIPLVYNLWKNIWDNQDEQRDRAAIDVGFALYNQLAEIMTSWDEILQNAEEVLRVSSPALMWPIMTSQEMAQKVMSALGATPPSPEVTGLYLCLMNLSQSEKMILQTLVPSNCSACCQESWSP